MSSFVAGQPPVYGQQIVDFSDTVLEARAALQAPSKRDQAPPRLLSREEEGIATEILGEG